MRIREADIEADRTALIKFLTANLEHHGGAEHYDWLYRDNPGGRARAWLGLDETTDRIIGAAAAFPRAMTVKGKHVVCWNLGDFAIGKESRSLGPAIRLQRACLSGVLEGDIPFAYDHPSRGMMAIYRRLGVEAIGRVVRFARPLRVDDKIKSVSGDNVATRGAAVLGNWLLSLGGTGGAAEHGFQVQELESRFDERFSALDERVGAQLEVMGRRTAEYLNWRYLDNPLGSFRVVTLQQDERLVGFAVTSPRGNDAWVVDLFGEQQAIITEVLLAGVVDRARKEGVQTLSVPTLGRGPLAPLLERAGFRARETSPLVVTARSDTEWHDSVTNDSGWFLTHGDRDV